MNDDRKDEGRHQPGSWHANFARLPPRKSTVHSYAITPRAAELERGRKLRLLEDGCEVHADDDLLRTRRGELHFVGGTEAAIAHTHMQDWLWGRRPSSLSTSARR